MQDKKKKTKKQSKIRDLKPKKDTKGGLRDKGSPTGTFGLTQRGLDQKV
jgi:hypothetical protein